MEVPSYRVLVLGESGVGKSSLVQRYVFDQFSAQGSPPSGREEERKTVKFKNGQQVELRICDTQGQERADLLTKTFYKDTDAIVFVYDMTNSRTLWDSDVWIRDWTIHIENIQSIPILFVGNKSDVPRPQTRHLDDDEPTNQEPELDDRGGSGDEGVKDFVVPGAVKTLVKRHNFIRKPLECSARSGSGVREVFETIAAEVAMVKQPNKRSCVCL